MEITLQVQNETGLHARPAAVFAQKADEFKADIVVAKGGRAVNAKDVISVMMLGIKKNDIIVLKIQGPDAAEAACALQYLVNERFGEG